MLATKAIKRSEIREFVEALGDKSFEVVFVKRGDGTIRQMPARNVRDDERSNELPRYDVIEKGLVPVIDCEAEAKGVNPRRQFGIPETKLFIVNGEFILITD